VTFWRHSLGCALVSRKMAKFDRYPTPRRPTSPAAARPGILVNIIACSEDIHGASKPPAKLMWRCIAAKKSISDSPLSKRQDLGRTVAFLLRLIEVIEFHHDVAAVQPAGTGVAGPSQRLVVPVARLGIRILRSHGHDLAGDAAWATLVGHYPALATMDLARFTMDIDGAMEEIVAVVDAVFKRRNPMVVRAEWNNSRAADRCHLPQAKRACESMSAPDLERNGDRHASNSSRTPGPENLPASAGYSRCR